MADSPLRDHASRSRPESAPASLPGSPAPLAGRDLVLGYGGRYGGGYRDAAAREVARGIDCELRAGRLVALLGPNGAGKSTLLRTLAGLLPPLGGEIELDGRPLAGLPPEERARRLAVVFTERVTPPHLSARELVALGRHPHTGWLGRLGAADHRAIEAALAAVGASHLAGRSAGELSDGELQRVAIARALAQEAGVLLLDEATAFLDLPRRVDTFELLRHLAHHEGKSILLSTHDLDLALRSADELWLLAPAEGTAPAVFHRGAPEELALAGTFGRVFGGQRVRFDLDAGAFRFAAPHRGRVILDLGEDGGAEGRRQRLWLLRALERLGFEPGAESEIRIARAEISGSLGFVLQKGGEERRFARLGALIEELEK